MIAEVSLLKQGIKMDWCVGGFCGLSRAQQVAAQHMTEPRITQPSTEPASLFETGFVQGNIWCLKAAFGVAGRFTVANEIDRHGRRE